MLFPRYSFQRLPLQHLAMIIYAMQVNNDEDNYNMKKTECYITMSYLYTSVQHACRM